jgi:hypothetical protein
VSDISLDKLIWTFRGEKVILDFDLAYLYGVPTMRLNEQVKRNASRFPEDFVFRLTPEEFQYLKSQFAASNTDAVGTKPNRLISQFAISNVNGIENGSKRGGRRKLPNAFTEHGTVMAASVLNSPEAVSMSVFVVRAFIEMRKRITANEEIIKRIKEIDQTILDHDKKFMEHDEILRSLWAKLKPLLEAAPEPKRNPIGFR